MGTKRSRESGKVGPEVIEHWYTLVPGHQFSSKDFYASVTDAIKAQQVPGLAIAPVDLSEGGALSDNREYLRMKRERLTFDVCAAPVGVNYFFSYRFYAEPAQVKLWEVIAVSVALALLFLIFTQLAGFILGLSIAALLFIVLFATMQAAAGEGMRDLDAALIDTTLIGPIYERFFRKDTYYRQDMRLAYCSIVSAIVKEKVDQVTAAQGIRLLHEFSYSPVFGDLYKKETIGQGAEKSA